MMNSFRKFSAVLLLLAPLLLGLSIQHSLDPEHYTPVPAEQSQSDIIVNSLSETMEEMSKEDDTHFRHSSFHPDAVPFSNGTFFNGLRERTVLLVPTPPPDLA